MATITENALDLLRKRYFNKKYNENSWDELCQRVSKAIADAEETDELKQKYQGIFYDIMMDLLFLPSTPALINSDVKNPGQLSSCFIIEVKDNIESIYQAKAECAKIFQKNGGVGFNISALRPAKADVETSKGYAGGPCDFMEEFDLTADIVTRNNIRKGAIKIDLACWHPDIQRFIHIKDDTSKLQHMNISVSITDDFMNAVKNDEDWDLKFPDYSWNKEIYNAEWDGDIKGWESKGYPVKIYQTLKAKDLYREIMESAWKSGEPGTSFINTMDRSNPNRHMGKVMGTNPCSEFCSIAYNSCLTGDTVVLTSEGPKLIKDMVGTDGLVLSSDKRFHKYHSVVSKGVKPTYTINMSNGLTISATEDHKFYTQDGWKRLSELTNKDSIRSLIDYHLVPAYDFDPLYEMYGWMHGDGWFNKTVGISFNGKDGDFDVKEKLLPIFKQTFGVENISPLKDDSVSYQIQTERKSAIQHCIDMGFVPGTALEKELPTTFWNWSFKQQLSFIRGLFSSDGGIYGTTHRQINLYSSSKKLLEQIQKFLYGIGICCRIYASEFKTTERNTQYRLCIVNQSAFLFYRVIGFCCQRKMDKFNDVGGFRAKQNHELISVKSIVPNGECEVFDIIDVDGTNEFYANGMLVHNCNLGSINLSECGNTKEEVKETLKWLVPVCVRFIDNMITVNKLPLDKISNVTKKVRSIGLGTFGLADLLFKLNIPYNTKDGFKYISELYNLISQLALKASMDLAEEKGCYDAWEGSEWQKKGIKIRNSNLLSIAPNGSIAFIAGEVSGGIEPQFALVMQRRTNEGDIYYIVNSAFESELRKRGLYSTELLEKIYNNHGSCKGIKEIPKDIQKVFVTAHDITPDEHLEVLAIVQSFVDLSVSKTINLPNNATVEEVMDIYMKAWEKGTKGVTIYRDGCRDLQVLSTGSTVSSNNQTDFKYVPVKPVMVEATAKRKKIHGGCGDMWVFMVSDDDGNLQEMFTQVGGHGGCRASIETISRLTSLLFRANVDPNEIIDQLSSAFCKNSWDKVKCRSCGDLLAKEIKKSLNKNKQLEDQKATSKCPDCGSELVFEGGCQNCKQCGWSKCESKG